MPIGSAEVFRLANRLDSNNSKVLSASAAYFCAILYPLFYSAGSVTVWLVLAGVASAVVVVNLIGRSALKSPRASLAQALMHVVCLVIIPALTLLGLLRNGEVGPLVPNAYSVDAIVGLYETFSKPFVAPAVLGPVTAITSLLIDSSRWRELVRSLTNASAPLKDADAEYIRLSVVNGDLFASTLAVASFTFFLLAYIRIQSTSEPTGLTVLCLITTALSGFVVIFAYFLMSISNSKALKVLSDKPTKPLN